MGMNQPPGDGSGRLPVDFRPRRLMLLPYNDLVIDQGLDQFLSIDTSGFHLSLALPYGMGPTEPKVFQMDAGGSLQVTMAGQAAGGQVIPILDQLPTRPLSSPFVVLDATNGTALMANLGYLFNGASSDRSRSASAANLAALSGLGVALTAEPGEWAISANPALGAVATASRGAGAAGVRHVCQGYSIIVTSQAAPAAGTLTINIRDGASGLGTVLEGLSIQIPAALYAPITFSRTGLNIVGSAATAMTIESTAAYAAVGVSLALEGYDAV